MRGIACARDAWREEWRAFVSGVGGQVYKCCGEEKEAKAGVSEVDKIGKVGFPGLRAGPAVHPNFGRPARFRANT